MCQYSVITSNINPTLADDMFSIKPQDVKILSKDQMTKYRLNQKDMAYQEKYDLWRAKIYGMTRTEYMEAELNYKNDIDQYCILKGEDWESYTNCIENFTYKHGLFKKPVTQ